VSEKQIPVTQEQIEAITSEWSPDIRVLTDTPGVAGIEDPAVAVHTLLRALAERYGMIEGQRAQLEALRADIAELRKPMVVERPQVYITFVPDDGTQGFYTAADGIRTQRPRPPWGSEVVLLSAYDTAAQNAAQNAARDNARWVSARDTWVIETNRLQERIKYLEAEELRHISARFAAAVQIEERDEKIAAANAELSILEGVHAESLDLIATAEERERQLRALLDRLGKYLEDRPQIQGILRNIHDDYCALATSPAPVESSILKTTARSPRIVSTGELRTSAPVESERERELRKAILTGTASMYAQQRGWAVTEQWMQGFNACKDAIDAALALPHPKPVSSDLRDYGYAPGNYMGHCITCDQTMEWVDKRCRCCEPCAIAQRDKALALPQQKQQESEPISDWCQSCSSKPSECDCPSPQLVYIGRRGKENGNV